MGQVIKGWDEGLEGMCLNEKRTLTIPAHKAYGLSPSFLPRVAVANKGPYLNISSYLRLTGSRGFGSVIPANSALVFDVELVGLDSKSTREEL